MIRIWWIKRFRARRAGVHDAEWALGFMRGRKPAPFIEDLLAEWAQERHRELSRFLDEQQRLAGRVVRIPVIISAAQGSDDPDTQRRALAEAGMRERARLEFQSFRHRLATLWAPYERVVANYRHGFYSRVPADLDLPEELLSAQGLPHSFEDEETLGPALPPGGNGPSPDLEGSRRGGPNDA